MGYYVRNYTLPAPLPVPPQIASAHSLNTIVSGLGMSLLHGVAPLFSLYMYIRWKHGTAATRHTGPAPMVLILLNLLPLASRPSVEGLACYWCSQPSETHTYHCSKLDAMASLDNPGEAPCSSAKRGALGLLYTSGTLTRASLCQSSTYILPIISFGLYVCEREKGRAFHKTVYTKSCL